MIDRVLNVGDKIWMARCALESVRQTCPICFGKLRVTLILGDESQASVECDYCGKGYEGPRGYVDDYELKSDPMLIEVTGRNMRQDGYKERWSYHVRNYYAEADVLYETQEEAATRCAEMVAAHEEDEAARAEHRKQYGRKSFSWGVGYHLREIKRCEQQIAWHRQRVEVCRAKSRKTEDGE